MLKEANKVYYSIFPVVFLEICRKSENKSARELKFEQNNFVSTFYS